MKDYKWNPSWPREFRMGVSEDIARKVCKQFRGKAQADLKKRMNDTWGNYSYSLWFLKNGEVWIGASAMWATHVYKLGPAQADRARRVKECIENL